MNLCPHCKTPFNHVNLSGVDGHIGLTVFKCVSYNCPNCSACLSVATDPIAVRTEIVEHITEELRRSR